MTLLGFWGFEDTVAEPGVTVGGSVTGRNGQGSGANTFDITVPTPGTTLILGGAANTSSLSSPGTFITFFEGATTHVTIAVNASKQITATRNGTVLGTSTNIVAISTWYYFEVKVVIHDTAGSVIVKVNGVEWINVSGVDTRNAGTAGSIDKITCARMNAGGSTTWDDIYLLNTSGSAPYNDFLGDVKVATQLPSGNGDNSDWVGSDADSTNNYQNVDETNSSSTDYNGSATVGNQDLYAMGSVSGSPTVLAVQEWVYAAKSDAGTPPNVAIVEKNGSTTRVDSNLPALSTTYQSLGGTIRTTAPDGSALSVSNVNSTQVGVKVTS